MERKRIFGWVLYDFANSVYPAVITATAFGVYYAQVVVGNQDGTGDVWWGRVASVSVLFVAASSPLLGAIADAAGIRKRMLFLYTYVCVAAVALFVTIEPGMVLWGFFLAVIANIGFEGALVYYNAYLPELVPREKQGFVSGMGFGVGYAGSLVGLLIALPLISRELFDLTWLSVAAFFAVASIPAFLLLPPDRPGEKALTRAVVDGLVGFRRLVGEVLAEKQLRRFLLAFFFYIDGVLTIIVFASLFAAQTLAFEPRELILLFLVVQVSALAGAIGLAKPTDRWGAKKVINLALFLWIGVVIAVYFVETQSTFFVVAVLAGFGLGSIQSASRSLMASLIPKGKEAEMFGFYALCGKSSSVLGPFIFGEVSRAYGGNQRLAALTIGAFFVVGLILLRRVNPPAVPAGTRG